MTMKILTGILAIAATAVLLWTAYLRGYVVTQKKIALVYREWNQGRRASFKSCSGFTQRVLYLPTAGDYRLHLKTELTKGTVMAEIKERSEVVSVLENGSTAVIHAAKGQRYQLKVIFRKADGSYELDIRKQ